MEGEEIKYSSHQLGSRIVEILLPGASDEILERFLLAFSSDLRPMCLDRFASHVLQKLIITASERGSKPVEESDSSEKKFNYDEWVFKVSKFVLNNFEEFVWDPYANHVFRTVLECLGGFSPGEIAGRSKKWIVTATVPVTNSSKTQHSKSVTKEEFKTVLVETSDQIMKWSQFQELPYNDLTSSLLQTLLYVISSVSKKAGSELIKRLLDECFTYRESGGDEDTKVDGSTLAIPDVFMNETASRVLDVALEVATPKRFTQIYARCFINNLGKLALMPIGNFQVQRLFQHCSEKVEFEAMYDEIADSLSDIFQNENYQVILSIAQACHRLSTKQGFFVQEMMKILHCWEPEERQSKIAPLIIKLVTYEDLESTDVVNINGSLLLQTLLTFSKPIKLVNSLLEMSTEELKTLFSNPKGSHVMEVFLKSESIGEKSREKMIRKMQGSLVAMACSKHGSRSLDAMWAVMNMKQKMCVMDELAPKEAILSSDKFGKIISFNFKLTLYKNRLEDWKDDQNKVNRKRALFQDIIGDVEKSTKLPKEVNK